MKNLLFTLALLAGFLIGNHGFAQIQINGQTWKPKTKEEKEAEKKKKEDEKRAAENQKKYPKEVVDRIIDKEGYPSYNDDKKRLYQISDIFKNAASKADKVNAAEAYPNAMKDIERMKETYKEYLEMCQAMGLTWHFFDSYDVAYQDAVKNTAAFYAEITKTYEKPLETGKRKADNIKSKVDYEKQKGTPLNQWPNFNDQLAEIELCAQVSKLTMGAGNAEENELRALKKQSEDNIAAGTKDLRDAKAREEMQALEMKKAAEAQKSKDAEMANVKKKEDFLKEIDNAAKTAKIPGEAYTGQDKQALKNIAAKDWAKHGPEKSKLVKVYVTGNQWERKVNYNRDGESSIEKRDYSMLETYFVYQFDGPEHIESANDHHESIAVDLPKNIAQVKKGYMFKNNMNGGTNIEIGRISSFEDAGYIYLSNLK